MGWKREPGGCRVFGSGIDGRCGWDLGNSRDFGGHFEGGEEGVTSEDVFERFEQRVPARGMCMQELCSNSCLTCRYLTGWTQRKGVRLMTADSGKKAAFVCSF